MDPKYVSKDMNRFLWEVIQENGRSTLVPGEHIETGNRAYGTF